MMLGIVAVLAAGVVFAGYKHHLQTDIARAQAREKQAPVDTITGTVDDLLATHRSMTCTFSSSLPDKTVSFDGVVYVANDRVRADVHGAVEGASGRAHSSHMIRTADKYYLWNDADAQAGYLIRQVDDEMMATSSGAADLPQLFPKGQTDYNCHSADHPAESFDVPGDITFVDVTEALGGRIDLPAVRGTFTTSECDRCMAFASDTARVQCKSILRCR